MGIGLAEQATKSMHPGAELGIADVLRSPGSKGYCRPHRWPYRGNQPGW